VADKGIGGPPMREARQARTLSTPWGATSKGIESLMRRRERERWEPHEVRRASKGAAASELVLGVKLGTIRRRHKRPHLCQRYITSYDQRSIPYSTIR
jgi:hypothetical protein